MSFELVPKKSTLSDKERSVKNEILPSIELPSNHKAKTNKPKAQFSPLKASYQIKKKNKTIFGKR